MYDKYEIVEKSKNSYYALEGILVIKFVIKKIRESLSPHTGLVFVGQLLFRTKIAKRVNAIPSPKCMSTDISNSDVLYSYIGLLTQGKSTYEDIEEFRDDDFFPKVLGIEKIPSCSTMRQRMDYSKENFHEIIAEETIQLLKFCNPTITPCFLGLLPLDIDVSPFDNSQTKKEEVSRTYKGFDGYSPIFAYIGQEGYCVNTELRPGKTHCQSNTAAFLAQSILNCKTITNKPLLVRLDSGNDSKDNIEICLEKDTKADFLIKRNLRKEKPEHWLEIAEEKGEHSEERPGKEVYVGSIYRSIPVIKHPVRIVFKVIKRTSTADGQRLLFPSIEAETYWTSLKEDEKSIIELYHDHGTCEQFHSEIKSDMGLERFPSGKFATNQLILLLAMLAYNILRLIGQESLKKPDAPVRNNVKRRRLKTVIQNLITMASKLVYHARRYYIKICSKNPWFNTFNRIYEAFQ